MKEEPKKKKKIIGILIVSSFILILILLLFHFVIKQQYKIEEDKRLTKKESVIVFYGEEEINLEYGQSYKEYGAEAYDNGKEVTSLLEIDTSYVDFEKVGSYKVIYTFIDHEGNEIKKERYLNIVDTKRPELYLNGLKTMILFNGETYKEPGATAYDNYDGDLSNKIDISGEVNTKKDGVYKISYKVCDSSNNMTEVVRTITVITKETIAQEVKTAEKNSDTTETIKQVPNYIRINLKGNDFIYLEWGETYIEPGYTTESLDGDINDRVIITGQVDNQKLGTYTLNYSITNSNGQTDTASRTIILRDTKEPEIYLNGPEYIEISTEEIYDDTLVTAIDNHDGDITNKIKRESNYIPGKIGTYYYKYFVEDQSGNTKEIVTTIKVVDRTIPTILIEEEKENVMLERMTPCEVMDGVIAKDNYDGDVTNSVTWTSSPELNFEKAGTYIITYKVKDLSGNEAIPVTKTILIKDTICPEGEIKYSQKTPTNGSITVTLTTSEEIISMDGWVRVDSTTYTKTYITNVEEIITIKDLSGNTNTVNIVIKNIDTTTPKGSIRYTPSNLTNQDVVAILTTTEEIEDPDGWERKEDGTYTKSYTKNTIETLYLKDLAGNSNSTTISISNIDKTAPVITIIGDNPIVIEKGSVYEDLGATAYDEVDGNITSSIIITGEVDESVVSTYTIEYGVTDNAGNTQKATRIVVVNDTTPPTGEITLSPNEKTNQDVSVTLKTSEEIKTPEGWEKVDDTTFIKTYTQNVTKELLMIKDEKDNIGTVEITVDNIDHIGPEISILGANPYYIFMNTVYEDPGATAYDDMDGEITKIEMDSDIDITMPGSYTVTYKAVDTAGNESRITRQVEVIDYSPNSNVIYSPISTILTNNTVVATLIVDREVTTPEGWIDTGDHKTFTKEYKENVEEEVSFKTLIGQISGKNEIKISNIDKMAPTGEIVYTPEEKTNKTVIATLVADEKIKTPIGWTKIEDTIYKKTFFENIDTVVEITDIAGNVGSIDLKVDWIDDQAPTARVIYSKETMTNENVIVTLEVSKEIKTPAGWTKVDHKTFTKEYSFNTKDIEVVSLEDPLGNIGNANIYITWIDKNAPELILLGDNPYYINQNEIYKELGATAIDDKDGDLKDKIEITGEVDTLKLGTYTLTYIAIDTAGNKVEKQRMVIVEDTLSPTATLSYTPETKTNQNVVVTLSASEAIQSPIGWEKIDNTTYQKEYAHNISNEIVMFYDLAGNSGTTFANITWIDKELPTGSILLNPTIPTNGNVVATLQTNKKIITPDGWEKVDDKTYTKIFEQNQSQDIRLKDLVGNENIVKVVVSNIDKTVPIVNITYTPTVATNGSVLVTIYSNEAIKEITGWKRINDTTYQKEYTNNVEETVTISDLVGNTITKEVNIDWINTQKPIGILEYSEENKTNKIVTVTLKTSKEIITPQGWEKVNATTYKKEYLENKSEEVTIEDLIGNTNIINVHITNIDKIKPTAEITYSTSSPTNGKVIVTITANEEISPIANWEKINDKTYMHSYGENTSQDIMIKDLAGNTNTVNITITNIDKLAPKGEIKYSKETMTNENVIVTLQTNEEIKTPTGWEKKEDTTFTKEYLINGSETIVIEDLAGNTSEVNVAISNIDKTPVTGVVTYTSNTRTKEDIVVTLTTNKPIKNLDGWEKQQDKIYTKTYTENSTETLNIQDLAGNTQNITIEITWIDKIAPTAEVTYSPNTKTNQDIVVTLETSEAIQTPEGWKKIDHTSYTKVYKHNMEEIVSFKDLAGNEGSVQVTIDWIDKEIPTAKITYTPDTITNKEVIVTLETSEQIEEITNWEKVVDQTFQKTYTKNIEEIVFLKDLAGNIGSCIITIDWIDKIAPTAEIAYSPQTATNQNVIVTLSPSKEIVPIIGWEKEEEGTYTRAYGVNVEERISFTDLAGNEGFVEVAINWIDKKPPSASVSYLPSTSTNQNVIASLTASEEIKTPTGWIDIGDSRTFTKEYKENIEEEIIQIEDLVGNKATTMVSINWIDKEIPTAEVRYSPNTKTKENVVVTLIPSEEIHISADWKKQEDGTYKKEYGINVEKEIVSFTDLVGNVGFVEINIDWIDKIAPIAEITYSPKDKTKEDVVVTLIPSEEIKQLSGWTKKIVGEDTVYTKTYKDNVNNEIVEFEDLAGNKSETNIHITWIDKIAPTVEVNYSPNTITKENVVVTLNPSEEIEDISEWEKQEDGTYKKEYSSNINTTIVVKDLVGNTASIKVMIDWIDKIAPSAEVTYSPDRLTNEDVTVTLIATEKILAPEGWKKKSDTVYTKEYKSNVTKEFVTIKDLAGNEGTVEITITWIDKVLPTGQITYTPDSITNGNVVATLETNKEIKTPSGWTKKTIGEDIVFTKTYSTNVQEEAVVLEDAAGNETTIYTNITWIDKEIPTARVSYDIETLTNKNVVVTLNPSETLQEIAGWEKEEDGTYKKTYYANKEETIAFKDLAGNEGSVQVTIDWIDKELPNGEITYNPDTLTNKNVIATLRSDKDIKIPTGWKDSEDPRVFTKTYESNVENEAVVLEDTAGNKKTLEVTINWIDKELPTAQAHYSITEVTNQDVVVTITVTKPVLIPEGWALKEEGNYTIFTKTYIDNTQEPEEVILKDAAGNEKTIQIIVSNINKNAPVITSITNSSWNSQTDQANWTNKNVTITPIITVTGAPIDYYLWNKDGGEWQGGFTETISDEGVYTIGIIAVDTAGNRSAPAYTDIKIDKTPPRITMAGDSSITILKGETYEDPGAEVYDVNTPNIQLTSSSNVDTSIEADYRVYYRATDIAGNTTEVFRRVYVTSNAEMRYYDELKAIEELVLRIEADEDTRLGTELTSDTPANIRGINYYKDWYLVTKQDLLNAGYQDTNSSLENYLDMTHANYIVRYIFTPGAVQSLLGEFINGSYVHTFNYFGDPETKTLFIDGLLTAVTDESTKTASNWGQLNVVGGAGTYDQNNGFELGDNVMTLAIDQTKPIGTYYTINATVKGTIYQDEETYGATIVAISDTTGSYLAWVRIRNGYLQVLTFLVGNQSGLTGNTKGSGYMSKQIPVEYENNYMNIQVVAQRGATTKVYLNGELFEEFNSGTANLTFKTLTIGDLRANPIRGLKYTGSIYNFALYSSLLSEEAIVQNWSYYKDELRISQ